MTAFQYRRLATAAPAYSTLYDGLSAEWVDLCRNLGALGDTERVFYDLISAYSAANRHYHGLEHLHELLSLAREFKTQARDYPLLCLAIWFHDMIQAGADGKSAEHLSAERACAALKALQLPSEKMVVLTEMILATRHAGGKLSPDAMLLSDMDLAILGSSPERFVRYEADIRREYVHFPDALYHQGRAQVMEPFFKRATEGGLYHTPHFKERYLEPAQRNLSVSLKQAYQQQFAHLMQALRQRPQAMPLVIGLCGGIGSGKSTVARLLAEQGDIVIGFDSIGHQVRDHEARAALIGHFGPEVLDATGAFDRGQLAQKALDPQHPEQRLWLNALMEPFMLKRFVEQFQRAAESPAALIIIEAARLPEFGIEPYLSGVLQVYANVEVAAKRIVSDAQRRDTPESVRQKIESQKAMVAGLEAISGLRLRNDGTPEDLQKAVGQYAQEWQAVHSVLSETTSEKSSVIILAPALAAQTGLHAVELLDALSSGDQRRVLEALLCNHPMLLGPDEIKSVRVSGEFFNRHRRVCEWIEEHGGRLEWHKPPMSVTEVSNAIRPLGPELPGAPVIITGTFDLLNNETLDFIRRAYRLFGNRRTMILAPSDDSRRRTTFPLEQRVDIASLALRAEFPNLRIHGYNGMTSTFAESVGATLILRRLRRFTDITSEYTDARALWEHSGGKLDTAYLVPDMHLSHMTPELVRQYARVETDFAHSIRKWCPPFIADLWEEQSSGVNIDFQRIWKLYRRHESQAPATTVPQAAVDVFSGIYAGSFSPPTYGHFEMVERASRFLSTVVMLASVNPKKKTFSPARRAWR